MLIVTAPLWFKAPFKILRLFVREKLRDRVYTVSIPQVSFIHFTLYMNFMKSGKVDVCKKVEDKFFSLPFPQEPYANFMVQNIRIIIVN